MQKKEMVSALLKRLEKGGVKNEDVTIIIALGSHRKQKPEEWRSMLGDEIVDNYRVVDHETRDKSQLVHVGDTSKNTPVEVNKTVAESDRVVIACATALHYFAGYSGCRKSILPGVCSVDTINRNHRFSMEPGVETGVLEGDPVHEDMLEAARMVGADFVLNVVQNVKKEIVKAFAGDLEETHAEAVKVVDSMYKIKVPLNNPPDVVVCSAGGHPKDMNLYQSLKAVENMRPVVKEEGVIIMLAECREGIGSDRFRDMFKNSSSLEEMKAKINEEFVVGDQKTFFFVKALEKADIYVMTELDDQRLSEFRIKPCRDLNKLVESLKHDGKTVLAVPNGGTVLPNMKK